MPQHSRVESAFDVVVPGDVADCPDLPLSEHYIPLHKSELVRRLLRDHALHAGRTDQFQPFCRILSATIHHRYHQWLEDLKDLYAPCDPDWTGCDREPSASENPAAMVADLFDRFTALLERANYRRLTAGEIEQAIGVASEWGVRLRVDFAVFQRLEVYVRGDAVDRRTRRSWRTRFRQEPVDVPIYERLVVIFQLVDLPDDTSAATVCPVHVKLFKNIPKTDLDMLLPGTSFRMSLLDRGKILLPTITGIAIAVTKIVKGALLLAFAGVYGILAVLGLVGGTVGYAVKSFLGYLRTKEKYQLNLTRSLYYQNLGNNFGVLCRVLDEAEDQEFLEALLAYALLLWKAGPAGWTAQEIDREAETYLRRILSRDVDFEIHDALGKLEQFGCAARVHEDRWKAVPLAAALRELDRVWDEHFRYNGVRDERPDLRSSDAS